MKFIAFLERHRRAFITVVIILCVIIMGTASLYRFNPTIVESTLGRVTIPVQGAFTAAGKWVSSKIDFVKHLADLEEENIKLRERNKELEAENISLQSVKEENEKLSQDLNFNSKYSNLPMEGALIKAVNPDNWFNVYLIDKGQDAEFLQDMAVIAQGGLAGRVVEVAATYSKFVTIIDESSSISAQTKRTGALGFVKGDARLMMEGKCRMELIPADADILPGDIIETSILSSVYPPEILIGTVVEVYTDPSGTKSALVEPHVDFSAMDRVYVVTEIFEALSLD